MELSKVKAVTNEGGALSAWNPARGYAVMLALPVLFLSILFILPLLTVIYRAVSQPPGSALPRVSLPSICLWR